MSEGVTLSLHGFFFFFLAFPPKDLISIGCCSYLYTHKSSYS